jgi:hypothetical protein
MYMKKVSFLVLTILVFSLAVACVNNRTSPIGETDKVATIVAGTISVMSTSTLVPAAVIATQTVAPAATQTNSLNLEDFPNRVFLGEDEGYSVYLIDPNNEQDGSVTGEIIIYDKVNKIASRMNGTFTQFGSTIVSDDGKGKYVFLSMGTYTSRKAIVISLVDKKQAVQEFCTTPGDHLFWNDYIIFNNCDTFPNRPWGAGEAPGITAINLKTGIVIDIVKSDLTHQFQIKIIEGDNLQYLEASVEKEEDWQNLESQNTTIKTYNLLSLESQ